jgi:hypothetical protein
VTWTCPSSAASATNAGACTRQLGSGAAVARVTGVQSVTFSPVSSSGWSMSLPATNPAYIGITVELQLISQLDRTQPQTHIVRGSNASGPSSNPLYIQTGVDLRNFA